MGQESLRALIARLIEDGKAYALAETAVVRALVRSWLGPVKQAAALLVGALFLVQAALTVLVAALGMALAQWLGPAGGLAVGAVLALLVAALLAFVAVRALREAGK